MEINERHHEQFADAVRAYWDKGREAGLAAKKELRDEVGDENMEALANEYEQRREHEIEVAERENDPQR